METITIKTSKKREYYGMIYTDSRPAMQGQIMVLVRETDTSRIINRIAVAIKKNRWKIQCQLKDAICPKGYTYRAMRLARETDNLLSFYFDISEEEN